MVAKRRGPRTHARRARIVSEEGPDPIDQHVGARIRQQRVLKGLSQTKLGKALGVSFQQVQKYERGFNRVGASNLHRIATVLGVDVSFFFRELEGPESAKTTSNYSSGKSSEGSAGEDPFASREILNLVSYYTQITDVGIRKSVLALLRDLSARTAQMNEE